MKRYRLRRAKPGELLIGYGRLDGDAPDIVFSGGDGTARADRGLLRCVLGCKRVEIVRGDERLKNDGMPYKFENSLFEELEARGYDLSTIKFSISKKEAQ